MMKKRTITILLAVVLVFAILQCIPIDRSVPAYDYSADFLAVTQAPAEIAGLVHTACYDCHSYETRYPWYAYIAPVGNWMQGHIREGRSEMNFSLWGTYDSDTVQHLLEECAEEVDEHKMPLRTYALIHREALLSESQRAELVRWFSLQTELTFGHH